MLQGGECAPEPPRGGRKASGCASGSEGSLMLCAGSFPRVPASRDAGVDGKDHPRLLAAGEGPGSPALPSGLARPHTTPQPQGGLKVIREASKEQVWKVLGKGTPGLRVNMCWVTNGRRQRSQQGGERELGKPRDRKGEARARRVWRMHLPPGPMTTGTLCNGPRVHPQMDGRGTAAQTCLPKGTKSRPRLPRR